MDAHTLYERITKNLKMGDAYKWAKDYFGVWHRSKVGVLEDAIESYADSIPPSVFYRHIKDSYEQCPKSDIFKDMRSLLLYVSDVAEVEGF